MRSQGLSGRRSIATAHSSSGPDALAHPPGGLRLLVPDGREDLQHVAAGHLRHQSPADPREGVGFQAAKPGARVPGVAPSGLFL